MSNVDVYQPMLDLLVGIRERRQRIEVEDRLPLLRTKREIHRLESELERCCCASICEWQKHWDAEETLAEFLRNDFMKMTLAADPEWKSTFEELLTYLLYCIDLVDSNSSSYYKSSVWGSLILMVLGVGAIFYWLTSTVHEG